MENKSTNKLVLPLIIFIILSIVLGGYIIYDQLNNKSNDKENETNNTENTDNASKDEEKQDKISVTDFYFDSVAIVSNGEVYVNVYGGTTDINNLFGEGTWDSLINTRANYKEYKFDNFEYMLNDNNTFNGMKLNTSNVDKVYSIAYGQVVSPNYGLILLNKDKTLAIISLYSLINGKTDVTPIAGLTDIENIVTENTNAMRTYAIDKDGNKIDLANYIPTDYKQF